jgi:nitroreductase / dihydropteridine reductase
MELLEALNWRYAAKNMNGQTVPTEKIDRILEAIRLSASSAGMQPYKVVVVADHQLKARIHEEACPQPQVVEGSHLLVFAAKTSLNEQDVDDYIRFVASERNTPVASLTAFSDSIKGGLLSRPAEVNVSWMARQAYIALGFGIVAAATEGVDATPMEGFNADKMDELLHLQEQGLHSVVVMALGYRDEEKDWLAKAKKVRQPRSVLFTELNAETA